MVAFLSRSQIFLLTSALEVYHMVCEKQKAHYMTIHPLLSYSVVLGFYSGLLQLGSVTEGSSSPEFTLSHLVGQFHVLTTPAKKTNTVK